MSKLVYPQALGRRLEDAKEKALLHSVVCNCMQYENTSIAVCSSEMQVLKRHTIPIVMGFLVSDVFLEEKEHFSFDKLCLTIEFFNGSRIYFVDASRQPSDPMATRLSRYTLTSFVDANSHYPIGATESSALHDRCRNQIDSPNPINGEWRLI